MRNQIADVQSIIEESCFNFLKDGPKVCNQTTYAGLEQAVHQALEESVRQGLLQDNRPHITTEVELNKESGIVGISIGIRRKKYNDA